MDSIKGIERRTGLRPTFSCRHLLYPSRPQATQAQCVKICLEKGFSELIITGNCKPDVLEAFDGRYFFNLPGQHLLVNFAQKQLIILRQTFKSLRESVYQNLLQTCFKPLLDQLTLKLDGNGIHLDFTALKSTLTDKVQTNPVKGITDLIEFFGSNLSQFQATDFEGWKLVNAANDDYWETASQANNLKDADDYRPGIRFAAPIDNPDYHSRQLAA